MGLLSHTIKVSCTAKAVYALQPDYSLRRLPLSSTETDQIFGSFMVKDGVNFDDLWLKKILPELSLEEDPAWITPPTPPIH